MQAHIEYDDNQHLLTLKLSGTPTHEQSCAAMHEQFAKIEAYEIRTLLIDYSDLRGDIRIEDISTFLDTSKPIVDALTNVKTAAVLNDALGVTSGVFSILFSLGVWIAVFKDRDQALDWLRSDARQPQWLAERSSGRT